ncbi:MAG: branched-chain amino acid ABC transporter permease [Burkholderiaceae bacterium]
MAQTIENILQILVAGLLVGCIYGLMCMGLGLVFGVMKIINFAHGEFLMLGMYATYFCTQALGAAYAGLWSPFVSALLVSPLLFALGAFTYRATLGAVSQNRRINDESRHSAQLVITLGLALIIQNGALMLFGSQPQTVPTPLAAAAWTVGPLFGEDVLLFINKARAVATVVAIVAVALAYAALVKTPLGKSVRAAADDPDAAVYCGIDVRLVYCLTFGLGAAITALAGGLAAGFHSFQPYVGLEFVVIMYAGVVLGGLGSILGAFWGGFTIGLIQQLSTLVLPQQLQNASVFVIFLLILLFLPQGLLGRHAERA